MHAGAKDSSAFSLRRFLDWKAWFVSFFPVGACMSNQLLDMLHVIQNPGTAENLESFTSCQEQSAHLLLVLVL